LLPRLKLSSRLWITAASVSLAALGLFVLGVPPTGEPVPEYRSGEVLAVDAAHEELTLREGLGPRMHDVRVLIRPATRITHDGVDLPLDDVRPGDHATVRVEPAPPVTGSAGVTPITVTAQQVRLARSGDEDDSDDDSP
jgi:hypothetical protein